MLLPRQKELQFKDFGSDYRKPSGGIYVEDGQDLYSNLNYGSTMDTKADRVNNFARKPNLYDDEDFTRAPSALKNRNYS